ncbi:MAG: IS110 family transposase [Hyphomicrobiales bacterium]|nr:IS110 family transposase [Hyphomicrobiales bacterium]
MDVIHDCVAGLDVHKDTVVACVRTMSGTRATRECRTYGTTTDGLLALLEWLSASGCSVVAMEATGVYWLPVWKILSDGDFKLILANAAHIKAVPGRKTDMNDAMWNADLAAYGLIKASFVPDEQLHELRTLTRTRKQLTREQTRHAQRIQKTLTEANIRLDSVISDIMGASGRRMIEAMIAGQRDPCKLAALAHRSVKASPKQLYDALHGRLTEQHRFLLKLHLGQWDAIDASIRIIDREIDARVARLDAERPADKARFSDLIDLLDWIPGVNRLSAVSVLSEIGTDMTRFDSDGHLVAWTGLCASQNESAGKRKRTRLRKGNPWLKTALVQCAWAAKNAKTSYYRAQFLRLKARRGPQKAICAVAASILTAIYHMLSDGTAYQDLGADYFDRRSPEAKVGRLVRQIARLGYEVTVQPTARAA